MAKKYTSQAVQDVIKMYQAINGEIIQVNEGVLGYGVIVCMASGYKSAVIQEMFETPWTSSHKITFYNHLPKKWETAIASVQRHGHIGDIQ